MNINQEQTGTKRKERKEENQIWWTDRKYSMEQKGILTLYSSKVQLLFNTVNGRVADEKVSVADAPAIGECMAAKFKGSLPEGFYQPIQSKVVTMEIMKRGAKIGDKVIYDMEKLYGRLLVMSQKRGITLETLLSFELAPMPSAIFDEYGCLRKGSKSQLVHRLAIWCKEKDNTAEPSDVDGS